MKNFTLGFNSLHHFKIRAFRLRHFKSNEYVFLYIGVWHVMERDHLLHRIPNAVGPSTFLFLFFKTVSDLTFFLKTFSDFPVHHFDRNTQVHLCLRSTDKAIFFNIWCIKKNIIIVFSSKQHRK
jgi:hypothetical protein